MIEALIIYGIVFGGILIVSEGTMPAQKTLRISLFWPLYLLGLLIQWGKQAVIDLYYAVMK